MLTGLIIILLLVYYVLLPKQLFQSPISTVVTSNSNDLIGAVIAKDGQWRFPKVDSVPYKFKQCIVSFEDAYFYKHFGFNPISILKAMQQNIKSGKVVRGGSTITQQVIRLSRNNKKRSYFEKFIELVLATRLEFGYSKKQILELYASHAPFGGNVVGLDMASWRYFGVHSHQLSWAESATLAVLPNAPSLIYPGKNQLKLKIKRNKLLKKLFVNKIIDSLTYELSLEEQLPQKPFPLPQLAPHLVQQIAKKNTGKRLQTSIDLHLQKQVNLLAKRHYQRMKQNEVFNLAVLVVDVTTKKVKAYVANSPTDKLHQKDVNNITAPRSTGSVLKPLLYAQMLQNGALLPSQLVSDVPTEIAGYTPKNFNLKFDGAIPVNQALTRSLNIPFVRLLQRYGLAKFRDDITDYKLKSITKSSDYYGLSLILGGAEENLWNLCNVYTNIAGIVNHYEDLQHKYYSNEFSSISYVKDQQISFGKPIHSPQVLDAGSAYLTLETLTEVNRPESEQSWKYYDSAQKIAWKTGTSFGNKDAWAIGITPKYVVGVWVGNSDGEGRPDLTGASSASPLMFSVFDVLPKSKWFLEPYEDLIEESICLKSGYLALPICKSVKKRIPKNGLRAKSCPFHKEIQLDKEQQFRVNTNCESLTNIVTKTWFSLPPLMAYYYKQRDASYRKMPIFKPGCNQVENKQFDFVFPTKKITKVSLTKSTEGKINPVILKITHSIEDAIVFWYLDGEFIEQTTQYHQLAISPEKGIHELLAVDNYGNQKKRIIEIH